MNTYIWLDKLKEKYRFLSYWQETCLELVLPQLKVIEIKLRESWVIACNCRMSTDNYKITFTDAIPKTLKNKET